MADRGSFHLGKLVDPSTGALAWKSKAVYRPLARADTNLYCASRRALSTASKLHARGRIDCNDCDDMYG